MMERPNLLSGRLARWLVALALLAPAAIPDTVYLKNGKTLEGLIEEESDTYVVVNFGLGTVRLRRSQIDTIARSGAGEEEAIKEHWKARYITHEKYVPAPYQDLAQRFKDLEGMQRAAHAAHAHIQRVHEEQPRLRNEYERTESSLVGISAQLAAASPEDDIDEYNKLVAANNSTGARLVVLRDQMQQQEGQLKKDISTISNYLRVLSAFKKFFDERHQDYTQSADAPEYDDYFLAIRSRKEAFEAEVRENTIPHEEHFGHMFVSTRINNQHTAELMLDTGASLVTLSHLAAERMGIPTGGNHTAEFRLADGSVIEAEMVVLDTVQVGDARVDQVLAAVIPDALADGRDGLLGMSFLREFVINYDAAGRELVLKRFEPR